MKYARLAQAAVVGAALVGLVFIAAQPASGQVSPSRIPTKSPPAPAKGANWYWSYEAGELDKVHAEENRLEGEAARLVERYSAIQDEAERGKIKAALAATLEKQFELQQKRRDLEVAQIEAQLKKLREIMRKRAEARQTIIDKRLDQLLREADGLGWTPPPGTPAPGVRTTISPYTRLMTPK